MNSDFAVGKDEGLSIEIKKNRKLNTFPVAPSKRLRKKNRKKNVLRMEKKNNREGIAHVVVERSTAGGGAGVVVAAGVGRGGCGVVGRQRQAEA